MDIYMIGGEQGGKRWRPFGEHNIFLPTFLRSRICHQNVVVTIAWKWAVFGCIYAGAGKGKSYIGLYRIV